MGLNLQKIIEGHLFSSKDGWMTGSIIKDTDYVNNGYYSGSFFKQNGQSVSVQIELGNDSTKIRIENDRTGKRKDFNGIKSAENTINNWRRMNKMFT